MGFPERAVDTCKRDWSSGVTVETHIRDVLKCRHVDVTVLEPFLSSQYPSEIRWAAARIISEKGRISEVVQAALLIPIEERDLLFEFLSTLGKQKDGLRELEGLVSSEDTFVRDAAVDMFRRSGQVDALVLLLFNDDDDVVKRIKRYIDEAGQRGQTCSA
jgi:hypothetical protein